MYVQISDHDAYNHVHHNSYVIVSDKDEQIFQNSQRFINVMVINL